MCALTGAKQPLKAAALKARYRSRAEYLRRFGVFVDQAVQARRLTPEDAKALTQSAGSAVPVF